MLTLPSPPPPPHAGKEGRKVVGGVCWLTDLWSRSTRRRRCPRRCACAPAPPSRWEPTACAPPGPCTTSQPHHHRSTHTRQAGRPRHPLSRSPGHAAGCPPSLSLTCRSSWRPAGCALPGTAAPARPPPCPWPRGRSRPAAQAGPQGSGGRSPGPAPIPQSHTQRQTEEPARPQA